MKNILIDTNALMAIAEFRLDIFRALEETCDFTYKISVLSGTIDELQKIMENQRGKFKRAAKLVLEIIRAKQVLIIKQNGAVDDLLVSYSKNGYLILTLDVILKKRLHKPYLTIRQKRSIVLVE